MFGRNSWEPLMLKNYTQKGPDQLAPFEMRVSCYWTSLPRLVSLSAGINDASAWAWCKIPCCNLSPTLWVTPWLHWIQKTFKCFLIYPCVRKKRFTVYPGPLSFVYLVSLSFVYLVSFCPLGILHRKKKLNLNWLANMLNMRFPGTLNKVDFPVKLCRIWWISASMSYFGNSIKSQSVFIDLQHSVALVSYLTLQQQGPGLNPFTGWRPVWSLRALPFSWMGCL